jgi:hypothetical protein
MRTLDICPKGGGGSSVSAPLRHNNRWLPATYATGFDTWTRGMHTRAAAFARSYERDLGSATARRPRLLFKPRCKHGKKNRQTPGRLATIGNFCAPTLSVVFADLLLESASLSHPTPPRTRTQQRHLNSFGVIFCDRQKVLHELK